MNGELLTNNEEGGQNPLWLPKGSVRSILAFVIVGGFSGLAIYGGYKMIGASQWKEFLSLVGVVVGLAGSIVGFYFGSKKT